MGSSGRDEADVDGDEVDAAVADGGPEATTDATTGATADTEAVIAALEDAHEQLRGVEADLEADPGALEDVAEAHRAVSGVLDRWEERATDWDDFKGYVEFRNDLAETLEAIPEDVPASDAFVEADRRVKTSGVSKALKARDFEAAREALAPAREHAEALEALREARSRFREARKAARRHRDELADRIDDLERLVRLGQADLDAPVETLREPIDRYNERLEEDFRAFRSEASARELIGFVATAADRPLVGYEPPPADLLAYVRDRPAGEHTVGQLLSYASYSSSKLDHYVDDPNLLKRRVATNRTYLERLSPAPLRVAWPPPEAGVLRARADAYVPLVGRFAEEGTVAALREVRALAGRDDYERLRTAAEARADLTDAERRRLASGSVEADLEEAREARRRLDAALEDIDQ